MSVNPQRACGESFNPNDTPEKYRIPTVDREGAKTRTRTRAGFARLREERVHVGEERGLSPRRNEAAGRQRVARGWEAKLRCRDEHDQRGIADIMISAFRGIANIVSELIGVCTISAPHWQRLVVSQSPSCHHTHHHRQHRHHRHDHHRQLTPQAGIVITCATVVVVAIVVVITIGIAPMSLTEPGTGSKSKIVEPAQHSESELHPAAISCDNRKGWIVRVAQNEKVVMKSTDTTIACTSGSVLTCTRPHPNTYKTIRVWGSCCMNVSPHRRNRLRHERTVKRAVDIVPSLRVEPLQWQQPSERMRDIHKTTPARDRYPTPPRDRSRKTE
eukprot:1349207-Rhodomonas_salina.3